MSPLFRRTQVWVVEFTWDGRPRRWMKALPQGSDAARVVAAELAELYGGRARLREVRPATSAEELAYVRGDLPRNVLCPTGRAPRSRPEEPPA